MHEKCAMSENEVNSKLNDSINKFTKIENDLKTINSENTKLIELVHKINFFFQFFYKNYVLFDDHSALINEYMPELSRIIKRYIEVKKNFSEYNSDIVENELINILSVINSLLENLYKKNEIESVNRLSTDIALLDVALKIQR